MWEEIREEKGQIRKDLLNGIVVSGAFFFLFQRGKVLKGVVSEQKATIQTRNRNKENANRRTRC